MATHIDSVASSSVPKVSKAVLYSQCRGGDLVFCWGRGGISDGIEKFTNGPSHVLMIWMPPWATEWLTLESTIGRGVHVGRFSDYVDNYPGDLVLCRRPILTQGEIFHQLNNGFKLLDDKYDTVEFASLVARKVCDKLPLIQPKDELYCSGLQQAISADTVPFHAPAASWNTPEDDFTDPSVVPVCALLLEGAA